MIRLRPLVEADLAVLGRFAVEPGLIGLDWAGFRDPQAPVRRWREDGYLGPDGGRLMVELTDGAQDGDEAAPAGFVGWQAGLCDDLFRHTPAYRIQAGTHPENVAEQKALTRAGFQLEGVIRGCEFRAGQWRDGLLYSRLRDDPAPSPE